MDMVATATHPAPPLRFAIVDGHVAAVDADGNPLPPAPAMSAAEEADLLACMAVALGLEGQS